ncbi:hypothetical protein [Amycolatopsis tolypomycina]|uniref:hypothetical protein n=1 Tax=Amycolatopsis tolypomycina TaxID=208445 RepID=UPI0033A98CD7
MTTPEQRSMAARIANYERWANTEDKTAATAPARRAFEDRFLQEADPDGQLPPAERLAKAALLRKAHFTRMALASSKARARKRGAA